MGSTCAVSISEKLQARHGGFEWRVLWLGVQGSGFRVWGLGFRVWGSGFGVWGLGFRVHGSGFRFLDWGLGFGLLGLYWVLLGRAYRVPYWCVIFWTPAIKILPHNGFCVAGSTRVCKPA